jgi:hypothetical protein
MNLKKRSLRDFLPGLAGRDIRWLPRILGTLIGLLALGEFIEGLGYLRQFDTRGIMLRVGFFVVFAGCVVGWFKELAASLIIIAGTAIIVISGGPPLSISMLPALVGLLYFVVHLAGKKE